MTFPPCGDMPPPYEVSSYEEPRSIREEVKRMALNITRFAGSSAVRGKAVFVGAVGRVWKAEDTTETLPGNRAAADVRARQRAGVESLPPRNEP